MSIPPSSKATSNAVSAPGGESHDQPSHGAAANDANPSAKLLVRHFVKKQKHSQKLKKTEKKHARKIDPDRKSLVAAARPKKNAAPSAQDAIELVAENETLAPHLLSNGRIPAHLWTETRGAKSAQRIIQQAAARHAAGTSFKIPSCPNDEFYDRLAKLPHRGDAFQIVLKLDLEAEALATDSDYDEYVKEMTNGRTTAGRGEMWIAMHFGAARHNSSDAPGSDGYLASKDGSIWELFSAKSCARSGIKLQLSALTTHGTRITADSQSLLDSIDLTHWQAIVDTTDIVMGVKLILFPSAAARDWVEQGLLPLGGIKAPRFYKLLKQSCQIIPKPPQVFDKTALKDSNAAKAKAHLAMRLAAIKTEEARIARKEQLRLAKAQRLADEAKTAAQQMKLSF